MSSKSLICQVILGVQLWCVCVGRVGRTFREEPPKRLELAFDPDMVSYSAEPEEEDSRTQASQKAAPFELSYNEIKDARWFYDTPGIMKDKDVRERDEKTELWKKEEKSERARR